MKRKIMQELVKWKNSSDRKPLVLEGARQVGKTWIMKEFGKQCFDNVIYVNFDEDIEIKEIFVSNKVVSKIIEKLSLVAGETIVKEKTLIILDEIQECPEALNCLKYFNENSSEYCVIAAGSLLGTLLATPKSYPVGQVNLLRVDPLTFEEFLEATDEQLYNVYKQIKKEDVVEEIFHNRLSDVYDKYLIIGGMPECVNSWINYKDPQKIDRIQKEIIRLYENDFAKHSGKVNSGRILMVFRSIVTQLAKENKKFIYGCIKEGARAREFEEAIEWLVSSGIINRVYCCKKNEHPLDVYKDFNTFKLYMFDTGLLKNMAVVDNESIILKKPFQFMGALTENYVEQQIKYVFNSEPKYFTFDRYEIDFLVQNKTEVIPIEVKSSNSISSPSLSAYKKKYNAPLTIKCSRLNYKRDENSINIPLYLIGKIKELI